MVFAVSVLDYVKYIGVGMTTFADQVKQLAADKAVSKDNQVEPEMIWLFLSGQTLIGSFVRHADYPWPEDGFVFIGHWGPFNVSNLSEGAYFVTVKYDAVLGWSDGVLMSETNAQTRKG